MQNKATKTQQIIGYLRVSTQEQGASGLGLDAQREAIIAYAEKQGGTLTLF
jgi:site-specific DNA recombinase